MRKPQETLSLPTPWPPWAIALWRRWTPTSEPSRPWTRSRQSVGSEPRRRAEKPAEHGLAFGRALRPTAPPARRDRAPRSSPLLPHHRPPPRTLLWPGREPLQDVAAE